MSQPLIFITGATGFIGSHVVGQSLEAGYRVRLSVRKEAQISTLRKLFSEHTANLDFAVIPDFTSPARFNKVLEDVTYVFHLASPMPGKGSDFKTDYLEPATPAKEINTIKRIVIVSSLLALIPLDALTTGKFTAKEGLNPTIPLDANMSFPSDPTTSSGMKYHLSKLLAHRATLSWASTNTPSFGITTLHSSFVFGRNMTQSSPEELDGTNAMLWGCLHAPKPFIPMSAVDVRDVAAAHLKALTVKSGAIGEVQEFILSAGVKEGWTWTQVADFARAKYSALDIKLEGPFEEPPSVDTQRAEGVLGMQWRRMEETMGSFLNQQVELRAQL